MLTAADRGRHSPPRSAAGLRLRFAGGVVVPFLPCRWSRVGTKRRVGMREYRCLPHTYGAVEPAAGQQLAIVAEHHDEYDVLGAGLDGCADRLAGGGVPGPHGAEVVAGDQQLAVGAERHGGAAGTGAGEEEGCDAV